MGEQAEDMINGYTCSHCGIYFDKEHGFPVLCEDCHEEDEGLSTIPKATIKEA